jgi:FtsZ-binding cell division protein ZapB
MNTGGPDIGFGNDTIDRLVQLEMEVKRLRKENQKLLGNTQDLMEENKRLRDVISEHKKGSKEQIEYVDSLKSLAVQVSFI